jgi:hypothetical protein
MLFRPRNNMGKAHELLEEISKSSRDESARDVR